MPYTYLCDDPFLQRLDTLGYARSNLTGVGIESASALVHDSPYLLSLTDQRIQLAAQAKGAGNPVVVDFSCGAIGFRGSQNVRQELLVKAVLGRDKRAAMSVLDMTGGLGRDSYILACAGCKVTTTERNPVVYLLLADGLYRASLDSELMSIVGNISLLFGDARLSAEKVCSYDAVYLDPMFPERSKSALVKKEMRVFRDVVGTDADVNELFTYALEVATKKVVVKRPRKSSYVMDKKPTYSVEGRSSRFDVYQRG
ncbi:hypothetical protein A9Q99_23160 [Gammaproteobacteria bacterium 45_16_T64]|nr:hypothetical protein A9Q99_23160 [Gammaproteobacteria bacterium 45_16_T64]